jgi:UDP-glucose 4-epimerase
VKIALITGSAGLIGAEAVKFFAAKGFVIVGIDNDMRKVFFGPGASTEWKRRQIEAEVPNYSHRDVDIRDQTRIEAIFSEYGSDVQLIIHTAAQVLTLAVSEYCSSSRVLFLHKYHAGTNPRTARRWTCCSSLVRTRPGAKQTQSAHYSAADRQ